MEIDAWEIIAIIFFYFLFLWGFRLMFFGAIGYGIGGMLGGNKGTKIPKGETKKESNINRNADTENA